MSGASEKFDTIDADLEALMRTVIDASASPADYAALEKRLLADRAARAYYLRLLQTDAALTWEHAPQQKSTTPLKPGDASGGRVPGAQSAIGNRQSKSSPRPTPFIIYPIAIAAAVLFAACGVAIYLLAFNAPTTPHPNPNQPNQPGPAVATLIEVSGGGDLRPPHDYPVEGSDYGRGEYTLSSGTAEFMLTNAVNVKLRGRSRMHMHNDMNVALTRGFASFVVPTSAKGFTVHLPDGARVVDLGTRFETRVPAEGRVATRVLQGSVDLYSIDGSRFTLDAGLAGNIVEGMLVSIEEPGLLIDGDFNGAVANGWTITGNAEHDHRPERAPEGNGFLNFNNGQREPNGVATQTFYTQPGREYEISMLTATYGGVGPARFRVRLVDLNGTEILNKTAQPSARAPLQRANSYRPVSFRFTAVGSDTTLSIHDESPNNGSGFDLYIDNVRIVPVDAITSTDSPTESLETSETPPQGDSP